MIEAASLLILAAAADGVLALVVWIGARGAPGAGLWSAGLVLRATAAALFAGSAQHAAAPALASGLLAGSISFHAAALLSTRGARMPVWMHLTVATAVSIPIALLRADAAAAIVFGALVMSTFLAASAAIALHLPPPAGLRSRAVLGGCLLACAITFALRGIGAAGSAQPLHALLIPEGLAAAMLVATYVAALVATSGYLLLCGEHASARAASIDALTGAMTRTAFHDVGEREMARAQRGGYPLSMILIDIDGMRGFNARAGQRAGDALLRAVVALLRGELRQDDLLARFGGDEIAVFLPMVPGPGAVLVAGRLRRAVAAGPLVIDNAPVEVTVSAGVGARLDDDADTLDALVRRTGEALALAQRRGHDRVVALSLGGSIAA
jgi:diguanylate cyclase (GGDEF)-like protein